MLPEIIKYGFKGQICCTQATYKLIKVMLTHGSENASNINLIKKVNFFDIDGGHGEKPNDGFGKTYFKITKDFSFGALRSSHVLGSCSFIFQWTEKNYSDDISNKEKEWKQLHFSGDIGTVTDNVMTNVLFKGHQTPYWNEYEKCIIVESTYGNITRSKENIYEEKINKLSEIIDKVISKNETVIIPTFALDRAQQILVDLFYIFKKYEKNVSQPTNEDWKSIIKNNCNDAECKDIVSRITTLQGKDKKTLRKKIKRKMENILSSYKFSSDSKFSEISAECQNLVAEIFEKEIVQENYKNLNLLKFSVDSPLIEKINEIYLEHLTDEAFSNKDKKRKFKYLSDSFSKIFDVNVNDGSISQKQEIKKILSCFLGRTEKSQNIIVTASGMCEEGSVINLLEKYLVDEKTTIILTGFQANNTNGFLLKNLYNKKYDENNEKEKLSLKLKKNDLLLADVRCTIEDLSKYYSGHADQEQLIDYIVPDERNTGKISVLLNHGTHNAREVLKNEIERKSDKIKVVLPEFNKWFNVVTLEYELEDIEFKAEVDLRFVQVGDVHIYYPVEYDKQKIQYIINYIKEL